MSTRGSNSETIHISEYPRHVESFETFYYLGEGRTLKETGIIRFQQLVPNCPPDDLNYEIKFASFYRKIKRWAKAEDWNEWVIRKEIEDRQKREEEMEAKTAHLSQVIKNYQDFIRQSLSHFADRAKIPMLLKQAIASGDAVAEAELREKVRRGEAIEIKNFKEANEMVKLDVFLFQTIDQLPPVVSIGRNDLPEEEFNKVDKIMEWFRRHSKDM